MERLDGAREEDERQWKKWDRPAHLTILPPEYEVKGVMSEARVVRFGQGIPPCEQVPAPSGRDQAPGRLEPRLSVAPTRLYQRAARYASSLLVTV